MHSESRIGIRNTIQKPHSLWRRVKGGFSVICVNKRGIQTHCDESIAALTPSIEMQQTELPIESTTIALQEQGESSSMQWTGAVMKRKDTRER